MSAPKTKPPWLRRRFPNGPQFERTRRLVNNANLHTVCQQAHCPNIYECYSRRTATFLILGDQCTRNCTFCAVSQGQPVPVDPGEPQRVAWAVAEMGLRYAVVTSVTRDDLPDGGSAVFAETIDQIRSIDRDIRIEVLVPDFLGDPAALATVIEAGPDVINHNVETVPRLYARVRPQADYRRSLNLLRHAADTAPHIVTKSGLMLGLGEIEAEVLSVLQDLRQARCQMVTMGQYLQPTRDHHPVDSFQSPEVFSQWEAKALAMGFSQAACSPLTRSSYMAHDSFNRRQPPAATDTAPQ